MVISLLSLPRSVDASTNWTVVAWNNLGMHCMDSDFSVFSILPPYNTINAHVVHDGRRVDAEPYLSLTYEAVADPAGSINRTSVGKGNFWEFDTAFFGVDLPADQGLAGARMPGVSNTPQPLLYNSTFRWFVGEGIPITPWDDDGRKNFYPMMRVKAYSNGTEVAHTDVVLPVSDEMDCRACHQSGSGEAAKPFAGWGWDASSDRDYRLNILRLHDENHLGDAVYAAALTNAGFRAEGLYMTVRLDAKPILCAHCHASEALATGGQPGVPPLTRAIHAGHTNVVDPLTSLTLDDSDNRSSCYRCHPGSETLCLRGAMGRSVASDGSMAMQCQSCHGSMSDVGDAQRTGWLQEPNCQSCHTGPATHNNGRIRYTSVYETNGVERVAVDTLFATSPNTPGTGLSLFRFSTGHGDLHCEACHGATHAEYPSLHGNDNVQSLALQGHVGMIGDCAACHNPVPNTRTGGPHGMHPVGQSWAKSTSANDHRGAAKQGSQSCRPCHGLDYRGTELSRMLGDRRLNTDYGNSIWWRGQRVGCYDCHDGPDSEDDTADRAPVVSNVVMVTTTAAPTNAVVYAADADAGDTLTLRIVSPAQHGAASFVGRVVTYQPHAGFVGSDSFTFAASDGTRDSGLGTGLVTVTAMNCALDCGAVVPTQIPVRMPAPFWSMVTADGCVVPPTFTWNFGDGSAPATNARTAHRYAQPGQYTWRLTAISGHFSCAVSGIVAVLDVVVDEDADGIGDTWEYDYFGRLGRATEDGDVDGDQFPDLFEFVAGTHPDDRTSFLGITGLAYPSARIPYVITWSSVSNHTYRVERADALAPGAFGNVTSGIAATPPSNVHTDYPPAADTLFYRIVVERSGEALTH